MSTPEQAPQGPPPTRNGAETGRPAQPAAPDIERAQGRFASSRLAQAGHAALGAAGSAALGALEALVSFGLEILRRALLSWGVFELARWLLPQPLFLGAHIVLIVGALMIIGGAVGFALCLPWAAVAAFVDWANPIERADAALTRAAEWGRFVLGWVIWCAPWALSAWLLSQPWQGHWSELATQLAHWLKVG